MQKIIGRGVLLLKASSKAAGLMVGYQLQADGFHFTILGGDGASMTIGQIVKESPLNSPKTVIGTGHIILNDLPASPHDAFYDIKFNAGKFGTATEFCQLEITEAEEFGYGPHAHFSNMNFTFRYAKSKLVIKSGGTITANIYQEVFNSKKTLQLKPVWRKEDEKLVFSAAGSTQIPLDKIGKLGQVILEVGTDYDRWAQVQALYTFEGKLKADGGEVAFSSHDISSGGAPPLYFEGKDHFQPNPSSPYGASWTTEGITFGGSGMLANAEKVYNPVAEAIRNSGEFAMEIWMKINPTKQVRSAQIVGVEGFNTEGKSYKNYLSVGQGPIIQGNLSKVKTIPDPFLLFNGKYQFMTNVWGNEGFSSPPDTLENELMQLVYSCDHKGVQRVFVNGFQIMQRPDETHTSGFGGLPDILNRISSNSDETFRIVAGNDIMNFQAWKGEIHQLAIYNRALTSDEVRQHYQPTIKLTGDFMLDNVIPPLTGKDIPFELAIEKETFSLAASLEDNLDIKSQLGFKKIALACDKTEGGDWGFSGTFQTRFWEDLFDLEARLEKIDGNDPALLHLRSPETQTEPANISGLSTAKFRDLILRIGSQNAWELTFGPHQEFGLISMILDKSMPDYGAMRLGNPYLILGSPITLTGKWLEEEVELTSSGSGGSTVLEGSITFDMTFSHTIPAPNHEASGIRIGDDIVFTDQLITITLDLVLQQSGFYATLKRSLLYPKVDGGTETLELAPRQLFDAPASKNELLLGVLAELETALSSLFASHRREEEINFLTPNYPWELLGMKAGRIIPGKFLEQSINLTENAEILTGSLTFDRPFSVSIPAPVHEASGIRTLHDIEIQNRNMNYLLEVELQKDSFLGILKRSYNHPDDSAPTTQLSLADRHLYQPPPSLEALLNVIAIPGEVKAQADTLYANLWRGVENYYALELPGGIAPRILLHSPAATIISKLPDIGLTGTVLKNTDPIRITGNKTDGFSLVINKGLAQSDVDQAFNTFLDAVSGLPPKQYNLLRQRVVERLPLDYSQLLRYYYGWDITNGYIDLHAGMRLRVDFQNYQFVHVTDPRAKSGFVGGSRIYIPINSYEKESHKLGFGPFLSQITTATGISIDDTGAGGLIDFLRKGNRNAYLRLHYPAQPSNGSDADRVVVFEGTDQYANFTSNTDISTMFFSGKALIVPEIQVFVNDRPVFVSVGTTLRQLIEMYGDIPGPGLNQDLKPFTGKSHPLRLIHEGVNSQPIYRFVSIPDQAMSSGSTDLLDLPLVKGDRFYF